MITFTRSMEINLYMTLDIFLTHSCMFGICLSSVHIEIRTAREGVGNTGRHQSENTTF